MNADRFVINATEATCLQEEKKQHLKKIYNHSYILYCKGYYFVDS